MVLGAVVGLLLSQVAGFLIYSPLFLGGVWKRSLFPNKSFEELGKEATNGVYAVCLFAQGCLVVMLHYVVGEFLGVTSLSRAVLAGWGLTLVVLLIDVPHTAFTQRPLVAFCVDHFFNLVVFVEMFVCLVLFA